MTRVIFLLLSACLVARGLKVMTFNIWRSGDRVHYGLKKVANQIQLVNPDVVTLQEAMDYNDTVQELVTELGVEWTGATLCDVVDIKGQAIVTKHQIIAYDQSRYGINLRIRLKPTGQEISVWSMHLHYEKYGPYEILKGTSTDEILAGENEIKAFVGRVFNIVDLLNTTAFIQQIKNSNNVPVIVAGDFNVPSDLDYTEATKDSHHGYVIEWPATKLLRTVAGMTDSFREVHPDPKKDPGVTWPVYNSAREEPGSPKNLYKDRIDFIFYRGPLRANDSFTYNGEADVKEDSEWKHNDYPSDHYAVVTDFENVYDKNDIVPTYTINYNVKEYSDYFKKPIKQCDWKIIRAKLI